MCPEPVKYCRAAFKKRAWADEAAGIDMAGISPEQQAEECVKKLVSDCTGKLSYLVLG